jgi:two-component system NarL family response regulator
MGIAVATVEAHRRNILRKLQLHSVADLTRYALRHGIIAF